MNPRNTQAEKAVMNARCKPRSRFARDVLLVETLQSSAGRVFSVGRAGDCDAALEREMRDILGIQVTVRNEGNIRAFGMDQLDRDIAESGNERKR